MQRYSAILGPVDSAFYYVERPETPMNIGALTIFDGIIDFDTLVEHIDTRLHEIPRYRERVIQAPFNLGQPTWIPDPDFYLGNHIKRVRLESPASDAQLHTLVGNLLSKTLDRSRPLWEIHVVEGMTNQTAVFFKVHHCMVDGLAAVELFTFLMDFSKEPPSMTAARREKPLYDPLDLPTPIELTLDSLVRDVSQQFSMLRKLGQETLRIGSILTDRDKRLKMMVAVIHLINDNLRPIKKLPINGRNSGLQQMVWAEFPLEEIHAIRSQCGASVNEVMLAMLAKAVERYSADQCFTGQPFLRVLVPFNMREEDEKGEYGNRISVLPIDIPFNIPDPLEHLKAVMKFSRVMKESSLAFSMDFVLTLPSLIPAVTHQPIWGLAPMAFSLLAHTWCTNVAAMPIPVFMMGHELKHVYGFFPLNPSMGLASVIVSYNGQITMSLITDRGIIKEPELLERYLKEAYYDMAGALPERQPLKPTIIESKPAAPETEGVKQNGSAVHDEAKPAVPAVTVEPNGQSATASVMVEPIEQVAAVITRERHKLFSAGWAQEMQEAINHSEDYRNASTNWTAGSLAFVMEAAPDQGFEKPAAVWFDLYRGVCRSARAVSQTEATHDATFVIAGSYPAWMDVLNGRGAPLVMLTNGRLKLKKGAMLRLLPHTRSAAELVRCAQRVPWD